MLDNIHNLKFIGVLKELVTVMRPTNSALTRNVEISQNNMLVVIPSETRKASPLSKTIVYGYLFMLLTYIGD